MQEAYHGDRILAVMRFARPSLTLYFLFLLTTAGGGAPSGGVDPALLGNLRWRSIGPANTGGRIDDFAVARVPGQPWFEPGHPPPARDHSSGPGPAAGQRQKATRCPVCSGTCSSISRMTPYR